MAERSKVPNPNSANNQCFKFGSNYDFKDCLKSGYWAIKSRTLRKQSEDRHN